MRTGFATFTLDYGRCPPWLFERMTRLARVVSLAVIREFGPEEFLKRMSDPVWFQSFGTVLAFDWNASGLTTTTLGALKEALRGMEQDAGVFIAGGKGKTSRKTPEQIRFWSEKLGFSQEKAFSLEYASRASAKVDSALIQDGFQLYHHSFLFSRNGAWAVIQQGMNETISRARRYHWFGKDLTDFIEEPHSGIASQLKLRSVLNLTSPLSSKNRQVALELVGSSKTLYRDLTILARKRSKGFAGDIHGQQQLIKPEGSSGFERLKILELPDREFKHHPVEFEFLRKLKFHPERKRRIEFTAHLTKALEKLMIASPGTFEALMMTPGIGGRTIRALSLVAEVIYGAQPSYEDPARYSFALGGKDGTPFPVDRRAYDETLAVLERALRRSPLTIREKDQALRRAHQAFILPGAASTRQKQSFAERVDQAIEYI